MQQKGQPQGWPFYFVDVGLPGNKCCVKFLPSQPGIKNPGSAEYPGKDWGKGCDDDGQCGKPSQFAEESDFIVFHFLVWFQGHGSALL
jgi:hypothetical protein